MRLMIGVDMPDDRSPDEQSLMMALVTEAAKHQVEQGLFVMRHKYVVRADGEEVGYWAVTP